MKTRHSMLLAAAASLCFPLAIFAQGTAFLYQGRLSDGSGPATGFYDLRFAIYDAANGGNQQGGALTNPATTVSNGLFTVMLDFGDQFNGANRWLEIGVRTNGVGSFVTLTPRQAIAPTPYAVRAGNATTAASASSVTAGNISGTIGLAQLPGSLITNGASGVNFTGTFSGNGAGLINLPVNSLVGTPTNSFVLGWGDNTYGELNPPPDLTNAIALATGEDHSLALTSDGRVIAWGSNASGQTNVPAGLSNVVAISAGYAHSLVLRNDGKIFVWGNSAFGITNIPTGLNNVIGISAGAVHNLALKSDGTVVAWGYNGEGETNVPPGLNNVIAVSGGGEHSLALRSDGTVVAWGNNFQGETNVPAGLSNVIAIAAGTGHSLALKSDGTVVGWGSPGGGSLNIPPGLSNVISIAAGIDLSAALRNDGKVFVWGDNFFGETTVPGFAFNTVALAPGCQASFELTIQRPKAPVVTPSGNNTFLGGNAFAGNSFFDGSTTFSGPILGPVLLGPASGTPQQLLQLNVTPGSGQQGMEIDSADTGYSPAILLNHTGNNGRNFRIASYGNNVNPGRFVIRDEAAGADRLTISSNGILTANGSGLTGLDAGNIATGTLPDARLSTNVALLSASQVFTGANAFSGSLGIGTANPQGSLHVYSGNNPTVVRIQSTGTPGFGRVEFVSNPQGDASEWRPGFIQSLDAGGFTGGIGFYVNGTGIGNRFATNEVMRIQNGRVGIGTNSPNTLLQVGSATCNGTTWANASDRNAKENFQPVNPQDVLKAVVALPISRWNYRTDAVATHLGPVAQDFHDAFRLNGTDDTHISTVDESGVALAAIQGLSEKLDAEDRNSQLRIQKLESENAELKETVAELKRLVNGMRPKPIEPTK